MAIPQGRIMASSIALAIGLAGCGGAGVERNSGFASTPPPPQVVPPPVSGVAFLDAPATSQDFAAFTSGDRLQIRYDAQTRTYEIMAPGTGWAALYDDPSFAPGEYHTPGPMQDLGHIYASTRPDHPDPALRYHHSSLASWTYLPGEAGATSGIIAFGTATPAGQVPVTGSASYLGTIQGSASIRATSGWGDSERAPIGGGVSLQFDFGNGALTGQIRPTLDCDCDPIAFPTLDFSDTVFGVGSRTFSGRFDTGVIGGNSFSGLFTGPNAEELIGEWAFPFMFEGSPHSATGVWIAKQGN